MSRSSLLIITGGDWAMGRRKMTGSPSVITIAWSWGVFPTIVLSVGPSSARPSDVAWSGSWIRLLTSAWCCIAAIRHPFSEMQNLETPPSSANLLMEKSGLLTKMRFSA